MALKLFNWGTDPLFDQRPTYKLPKNGPILGHDGSPLSRDYNGYKVIQVTDDQGREQNVLIAFRNHFQVILVYKKGRFEEVEIPDAIGEQVHELKVMLAIYKKNIEHNKDILAGLSQKQKNAQVEADIKVCEAAIADDIRHFDAIDKLIAKAEKLRAEGMPMPNEVESFSVDRRKVGKRYKNVIVGKIGKRSEILTDDISKVSTGANFR